MKKQLGYFDNFKTLETLNQIKIIITNITKNDLRNKIIWLSHLRHTQGFLDDSIRELDRLLTKSLKFEHSKCEKEVSQNE